MSPAGFASADRPRHSKRAIKDQPQPACRRALIHHPGAGRRTCQLPSASTRHKARARSLCSLEGAGIRVKAPRRSKGHFPTLGEWDSMNQQTAAQLLGTKSLGSLLNITWFYPCFTSLVLLSPQFGCAGSRSTPLPIQNTPDSAWDTHLCPQNQGPGQAAIPLLALAHSCCMCWASWGWSLKSKTEEEGEKRSSSFTWKSSCLPSKLQSCFLTCIRNVPLLLQGLGNSAALAGSPCHCRPPWGHRCWPGEGQRAYWQPPPRADPRGPDPAAGPGARLLLPAEASSSCITERPQAGVFIQASAKSPLLGAAGGSHAGKLLGAGDQEPGWGRQGSSLHAPPWKRLQSPAARSQIQIALLNEFGEANLGALAEGGGGFMRFR